MVAGNINQKFKFDLEGYYVEWVIYELHRAGFCRIENRENMTPEEVAARFGPAIADIVMEVTDDKALPKAERKRLQIVRAGGASPSARLVKIADKICNLRDITSAPPVDWDLARRQAYFDWARELVNQIRGSHAGLEDVFDAAYAQRPIE